MRPRLLPGLILGLAATSAGAALHGRLPATPGGSDYQAYYDDVLNITWLADANAAQTSGYDALLTSLFCVFSDRWYCS